MAQVDLETLVTASIGRGNERKIAGETLAAGDVNPMENDVIPDEADVPPDFPPESFWLSKDAEYDWFDRNAFFERKESTKGTNSNSTNLNPNVNPSISQRNSVNLKSKASLIGLPKTQKAIVDSKRRACRPASISLFPKRSIKSVGKSSGFVVEPGSPKVSCMGRVRSKRGRRRSNSLKRREKPVELVRTGDDKKQTGFYSKVMSMFRYKKGQKKPGRSGSRKVGEVLGEERFVEPPRKSVGVKIREIPVGDEPVTDVPGLGGMKRFASGRRSGSCTGEDFNQGELDRTCGSH